VLDRNFSLQAINTVCLADFTYIATGEGWLYLAAVMDLCLRKINVSSMSEWETVGTTAPGKLLCHIRGKGPDYLRPVLKFFYQASLKKGNILKVVHVIKSLHNPPLIYAVF